MVFPGQRLADKTGGSDLQRTKYILDVVPTLIAADPGFPPWYANAFRDRWRFAACRLALQADPIERAVALRTGRAFRRREGRIGVDFGVAAPELGSAW